MIAIDQNEEKIKSFDNNMNDLYQKISQIKRERDAVNRANTMMKKNIWYLSKISSTANTAILTQEGQIKAFGNDLQSTNDSDICVSIQEFLKKYPIPNIPHLVHHPTESDLTRAQYVAAGLSASACLRICGVSGCNNATGRSTCWECNDL